MFKHFLISRLNFKKKDAWNTNKNNKLILTKDRHINRF